MKKKLLLGALVLVPVSLVLRFVELDTGYTRGASGASLPPECATANPDQPQCAALRAINAEYVRDVKPIFDAKCNMCHAQPARLPLYAWVPPVSLLVRHDMKDAREHLDFDADYPFAGRRMNPLRGLKKVDAVVDEGSMPPAIYLVAHWQSALSLAEREVVQKWVRAGRIALGDKTVDEPRTAHDHGE